jgi:hypothetical protein
MPLDGEYAFVASKGGPPENPEWYHNLQAHPDEVMVQDGQEPFDVPVRGARGRAGRPVGAGRRGFLAVHRVPGEDGSAHPRPRGVAETLRREAETPRRRLRAGDSGEERR